MKPEKLKQANNLKHQIDGINSEIESWKRVKISADLGIRDRDSSACGYYQDRYSRLGCYIPDSFVKSMAAAAVAVLEEMKKTREEELEAL